MSLATSYDPRRLHIWHHEVHRSYSALNRTNVNTSTCSPLRYRTSNRSEPATRISVWPSA